MMKTNYHTHTTWCDGRDSPEDMIRAALDKGFDALGFSAHATYPDDSACTVPAAKLAAYFAEIRVHATAYANRIKVLCGLEADYIPGVTEPSHAWYAAFAPDYLIGSVHYVIAPDGARVPVDHSPPLLQEGLAAHFAGDAKAYLQAYFAQEREMVSRFDFEIVGHADLCRKFNVKHPYFDETAAWYHEELVKTADAIAASGKIVEVNTGAISRGWLDDAYPSPAFRALLRERGVRFVLSSDSHTVESLDCAFERFASCERYVEDPFGGPAR